MVTASVPLLDLSPNATAALERLGLSRAAGFRVARDALRTQLAVAGWPCSEAILAAEDVAGGLGHPGGGVFGVFASMRYLRGEVAWERDDLQDYGLSSEPGAPSRKLLPLWVLGHPRCWISLEGAVFLGDHMDRPSYLTRAFEDVVHYWEVLLLLDGLIAALVRPLVMPRYRLESAAFAGESIAREVGLSVYAPATRGGTRAWMGDGANAAELDLPGFKRGTDVVSDTAEGIVMAAARALDGGEPARITGLEEIPGDLMRELPVPTRHEHGMSHVYTWGKLLDYSEARYRRRHREQREAGAAGDR